MARTLLHGPQTPLPCRRQDRQAHRTDSAWRRPRGARRLPLRLPRRASTANPGCCRKTTFGGSSNSWSRRRLRSPRVPTAMTVGSIPRLRLRYRHPCQRTGRLRPASALTRCTVLSAQSADSKEATIPARPTGPSLASSSQVTAARPARRTSLARLADGRVGAITHRSKNGTAERSHGTQRTESELIPVSSGTARSIAAPATDATSPGPMILRELSSRVCPSKSAGMHSVVSATAPRVPHLMRRGSFAAEVCCRSGALPV